MVLPTVPEPPRRRRTGLRVAAGAVLVAGAAATGVALSGGEPTSPGPTPTQSVDRHAALAARLPASVYTSCKPAPLREKRGVVTAVDCVSTEPGAAEVLVSQWAGPAAMAADFAEHYAKRLPDGTCRTTPEVRSTWEFGRLACYTNSAGASVLMYEYENAGLQVLALRKDGDRVSLYAWWHDRREVPVR